MFGLSAVFILVLLTSKKVDVGVKISMSRSILTWDPNENVKKVVQAIRDVNPHNVKNVDVVTTVQTAFDVMDKCRALPAGKQPKCLLDL